MRESFVDVFFRRLKKCGETKKRRKRRRKTYVKYNSHHALAYARVGDHNEKLNNVKTASCSNEVVKHRLKHLCLA